MLSKTVLALSKTFAIIGPFLYIANIFMARHSQVVVSSQRVRKLGTNLKNFTSLFVFLMFYVLRAVKMSLKYVVLS